MAHRPIGAATSIATSGTATTTSAISVQSDVFRIVAVNTDAYVAIGTDPVAAKTDYLISANTAATLAVSKASQRVVGVTTGTTTIITCPEGTQMPFGIGECVTLSGANESLYNTIINHARVTSVNTNSSYDGNFQTSITVDADTSGILTAFSSRDATLRRSIKVSAISQGGTGGSIHVQQVQISGQA